MPSSGTEVAKKLEFLLLEVLKLKEAPPVEIESQSNSERFAHNKYLVTESVASHVHHEWRQQTEDLCIGNSNNEDIGKSENSDNLQFSESSVINMERTEIVHIDSPAKFYIKNKKFEINQMELNKYANTATLTSTVDMNMVYLVQKSNDMNWYRAKVCTPRGRNENEFLMIFIDCGYKHVVHKSK